jgi:hypothetical protein
MTSFVFCITAFWYACLSTCSDIFLCTTEQGVVWNVSLDPASETQFTYGLDWQWQSLVLCDSLDLGEQPTQSAIAHIQVGLF